MSQFHHFAIIALLFLGTCIFAKADAEISPSDLEWNEILERSFFTIDDDFENITLGPFRNPTYSLLLFGGSLALVPFDKITTGFLQDNLDRPTQINVPTLINTPFTVGVDGFLLGAIGAWYLSSLTFDHSKGQAAGVIATKAVIYSFIFSHIILKTLFGRTRPDPNLSSSDPAVSPYTKNPWDFGNFSAPPLTSRSEGTSFPSFHFTLFFAVARVFELIYDNSWLPYSIATAGLLINFSGHHHWLSDMFGGAVTGIGIGSVVVNNFFGTSKNTEKKEAQVLFLPYLDSERVSFLLEMPL